MKAIPFVVVGAAVAWMAAATWWITSEGACGCAPAGQRSVPLRSPIVHVSAAPAVTTDPVATGSVALETASAAPAPPEVTNTVTAPAAPPSLLSAPFIVPFVKNQGGGGVAEGFDAYAAALADHLAAQPGATVIVTGHTDGDGDPELNRSLSLARADRVKEALIAAGVPAERIESVGAGAEHPIADNLTSAGKAKNRRVEIQLAH